MKNIKRIISILVICQAFLITAFGQSQDSLTLKDLEIPNSPGFILLDKSPTTIERPNSSKAFVFSILNSLNENNGIPQNYAVDFTPFWFFKHQNMTAFKYAGYNTKTGKQLIFSNLKKASLSFAFVTSNDSLTNLPISNLSFGIRTNIISVRSKQNIKDLKAANAKVVKYLRRMDERLNDAGITYPVPVEDTDEWRKKKKEYDEKVVTFLKEEEIIKNTDKSELSKILKRRAVFAIDGAIGYNSFYLNNNFSSSNFGRFGVWLTANYSQILNKNKNNYLNLYAIGRYISDGTAYIDDKYLIQNFYDYGGKIEFEFEKLSIAYEYIYRNNENLNTFRSNGILKYKISDKLYLTGAFGKNFGDQNDLISLFGLNWGILNGTEKAKILKE